MAFLRLSTFALLCAALVSAVFAADLALEPRVAAVSYGYAGQSCGTYHKKCRSHLVCEKNVCKIPRGGNCDGRESLCAKHLQCASKIKRASKQCLPLIPAGGDCLSTPTLCKPGLVCAGKKYKKNCVWPVGPKGYCDAFYPCRAGLVCNHDSCRVPINGDCKDYPNACVKNAVCAGNKYKLRCVYPVPAGGECGKYPLQVCASGLSCRNYRCVSPVVKEGGNCLPKGSKCASGLVCLGDKYEKKCVRPSGENGSCATQFQVCQKDLTCRFGVCRDATANPGGRCSRGRPCKSGLVCRRGGSGGIRKTCVALNGVGGVCTIGLETQCKDGLVCKSGTCRYH